MTDYELFLERKQKKHIVSGFEVNEMDIKEQLFHFQKFVVKRTLLHGKYAVFSGTGTGKTRMQLSWADKVTKHTCMPVLILAPLAVSGQTIEEGININIICENLLQAIDNGNFLNNKQGIYIINYDQLDNIENYLLLFGGVALDEGSVLKNKEGATRNKIIDLFTNTKYKAVFTATPSPNDPTELGSYSEFLGIMSYNEMLSMFFVHDGGATQKWRLKKHGKRVFWEWVSTWAIMFQHPKDIGFDEVGFDLPPLNLLEKQIITGKRDNGLLFNDVAVSATTFNQELRLTRIERLNLVSDIINNSTETFIIWVKQNEEADLMKKLIPEAIDVRGSDSIEYKEEKLLGFAKGMFRVLITKTSIAGKGLNFQICHNQIFASIDFSFEQVYQSIRRSLRFKQLFTVNVWLVTTDTMTNVIQTYYRKERQFEEMQHEMTMAANKNINDNKKVKMERQFEEYKTDDVTIQLGDAVQLIKNISDESIGLSVYSPPFADLYCYSDQLEDMGNSNDYKEFLIAFGFLAKELYRVMMSGRNIAIHCMDLPIQKGKEGYIGLRSFSNMIINLFEECGFIFHSEIVCWKNPVTEMQRTKALGLLHKQIKKDSTMSRVGIPDKVLVFRKDGVRSNPVTHQDKDISSPDYLSVDMWQKLASPVWFDIDFGNTLNFRSGRDDNDEKHICPLSLDIIERIIKLYSNVGDTILTPFLGIGSEVYQAIKMDRKGIGFELKKSYYDLAKKNITDAILEKKQLTLI